VRFEIVTAVEMARETANITVEPFGVVGDEPVKLFTITNGKGMKVGITNYGGIIQSIWVPDAYGILGNVALGFSNLQGYLDHVDVYFGSIIGRYANRVAGGSYVLDGVTYRAPANVGLNSLHGGNVGFDQRVWTAETLSDGKVAGVRLSRLSPDGEEGYPGNLQVAVTYTLTSENAIHIHYQATTDAPTVINLTNHTYFNLAGEGSGDVYGHVLQLNAGSYAPIDEQLLPTGALEAVAGTPLDFVKPTPIGKHIRSDARQVCLAAGFDHNYVLNRVSPHDRSLVLAATVHEPGTGRTLRCFTTEPGIQLYTGNFLRGVFAGTSGRCYRQGDAFALETQHFPDSPNHAHFPSTVLRPGQTFDSSTVYEFSS